MYSKNVLELIKFCDSCKRLTNIKKINNRWYNNYLELVKITNFLDNNVSIRERIYYVKNEITELVKCDMCKVAVPYWNERGDKKYTYNKYCSKCAKKSPEYRENYKNAMVKTYGVEHNWKLGYLRDNGIKNLVLKFGTQEEIDNIDNIKSSFSLTFIRKKAKESILERYGIEHNWNNGQLRDNDTKNQVLKFGTQEEIDNIDNIKSVLELSRIKEKIKLSLDKIDNNTGLTKCKLIGIKTRKTLIKIDPKTGLSGYQQIGIKSKQTKLKINPKTGLTSYESGALKIKKSHRKFHFYKIKAKIPNDYELLTTINEYINKNNNFIKYKHKCGEIRESSHFYIRCLKCYPYNKSIAENEILEFCQSLIDNVQSGNRQIIKPLELDIYIPDHNLAIEYNGLFWHSSYSADTENKNRHLNKTKLCKEKGIQLFHIFENEWKNLQKQEIWKSIIKNKLGKSSKIFARKCKIKEIASKDSKEFLENNHLQGSCPSSINIGLYYNNELVSIMVFGKSRYNKKIDWELLRFCNKLNYSVVGGASRLFKNFLKGHTGSVISYADMRRSTGNLYKQLGFELSHESGPNYWYWKPRQYYLESRIQYQKHKLKDKLEEFDEKLTESENMYNNGFRKMYDCGNQIWIYN